MQRYVKRESSFDKMHGLKNDTEKALVISFDPYPTS